MVGDEARWSFILPGDLAPESLRLRRVERDEYDESGGDLNGEGSRQAWGAGASLIVCVERFECEYRLGGDGGRSMYRSGE